MTALAAALAVPAGPMTVDVELAADERGLVVVGPNGAGKTTILRGLLGVRPARGTVRVGEELLFDSARGIDVPTEERRLAYVPQDYALFPHLSAADNVAFALRGPRVERRRQAGALLERLGVAAIADRRPAALSGGERQRVALARALALEPRALLLDEPLAALDVEAKDGVRAFLAAELRKLGRPFVLITHDADDVRAFGAPILVVEKGRVAQRGELAALARSPATAFAAKFFAGETS